MGDQPILDSTYFQQLIDGDEVAYRYFIRTYQNMAFTLAVSIVKDEFVAQEVAQDAFLKAFNGIRSFNHKSSFKTWFFKIIVNEAFQRLKKMKKEILSFQDEYEKEILDENYIEQLHEQEKVDLVNKALLFIPANESLALRLFYLEDESIKNICAITGWSISNAKVVLHRARKSMFIMINQLKKTV